MPGRLFLCDSDGQNGSTVQEDDEDIYLQCTLLTVPGIVLHARSTPTWLNASATTRASRLLEVWKVRK